MLKLHLRETKYWILYTVFKVAISKILTKFAMSYNQQSIKTYSLALTCCLEKTEHTEWYQYYLW